MSKEIKTVWITKYALSDKIYKAEMEMITSNLVYGKLSDKHYAQGFGKSEFYLTEESALVDFHARKLKKIESLQKQIEKLKSAKPKISK